MTGPESAEEAGTETPAFLRGPAALVGSAPDEAVVVEAEAIVAAADALIEAGEVPA